jgi:hypothetical protein
MENKPGFSSGQQVPFNGTSQPRPTVNVNFNSLSIYILGDILRECEEDFLQEQSRGVNPSERVQNGNLADKAQKSRDRLFVLQARIINLKLIIQALNE